jgi:transcription initiation factor TFIIIB Brf1 subunit/transcription initiation factor TFIIB
VIALRCWFGHQTAIVTADEGQIVCTRCGVVLDRWPLLRPEHQVRQDRHEADWKADRERRAQGMSMPARSNVRPFPRMEAR